MGRTHDFHCSNCHCWVNGFGLMAADSTCCDKPDLFYDLNHEAECCA